MAWALVTGSSRRLGADLALALAAMGYNVLIHYRADRQAAEVAANGCRELGVHAELLKGDLADQDAVYGMIDRVLREFPDLGILVNNVGPYVFKGLLATTPQEWRRLFDIQVHAPYTLIQGLLPVLRARRGQVINIGVAGLQNGGVDPKRSAYKIAKTTFWLQTRALAKELAPTGVRVNMISPGYLENSEELPNPMPQFSTGRPGTSEEVVEALKFFLDPRNEYVTGQNLEIAGGVAL